MKIRIKRAACLLAIAAIAYPLANAQDALRSGYFFEGYYNRHNLNPAFAPERNYFTIPALGGFTESLNGNVGLNTFLYPRTIDGTEKLTTFMSPMVAPNEFLPRLKSVNHINENFYLPVLEGGVAAWGGYNTVGISVTANANVALPRDLFTFMKLGMTSDETVYDFSDLTVDASAMARIAFGHSRQILPQLRVGAKLKFLLGAGNAHGYINNFEARLSNDKWLVTAHGAVDLAAGSGLRVPTKGQTEPDVKPEDASQVAFDDIEYNSFSLSGFGMALDLGAVYQLTPDLELSASLIDLGFISWSNVYKTSTSESVWEFNGFKDIALSDKDPDYESNKLSEQFSDLGDQLQDCFDLRLREKGASRVSGIGATFAVGASYTMPFYRGLKGGFLFTQRINGAYSWSEGRLSANVSPVDWFDAGLNYGISNFGSSMGWMINFHPKAVNFFIGADYQFFKITPQFIPVGNANVALSFGFNWNFGSKKSTPLTAKIL